MSRGCWGCGSGLKLGCSRAPRYDRPDRPANRASDSGLRGRRHPARGRYTVGGTRPGEAKGPPSLPVGASCHFRVASKWSSLDPIEIAGEGVNPLSATLAGRTAARQPVATAQAGDALQGWILGAGRRLPLYSADRRQLEAAGFESRDVLGMRPWECGAVPVGDEGGWSVHKAALEAREPFADFVFTRVNIERGVALLQQQRAADFRRTEAIQGLPRYRPGRHPAGAGGIAARDRARRDSGAGAVQQHCRGDGSHRPGDLREARMELRRALGDRSRERNARLRADLGCRKRRDRRLPRGHAAASAVGAGGRSGSASLVGMQAAVDS